MKEDKDRIVSIELVGPYHFSIVWNCGEKRLYRLSDIQRQCPCLKCRDQRSGAFIKDSTSIKDDLVARRIVNVGNYALHIEFAEGCRHGIYPFSLLKKIGTLTV